jgi:hypothetical protein
MYKILALKSEEYLKVLGIDEKVISKLTLQKYSGKIVDWIDLTQDTDYGRADLNLRFP